MIEFLIIDYPSAFNEKIRRPLLKVLKASDLFLSSYDEVPNHRSNWTILRESV